MRTTTIWLCVGIWLRAAAWANASTNLLSNSSFETGLSEWSVTGTVQHIQLAGWHVHTPRSSLGFGNDSGPVNAYGSFSQSVMLPEPLSSPTLCTFSIWAMMEANHAGLLTVKLECLDSDGNVLKEYVDTPQPGAKEKWKQKVLAGPAPQGTRTLRVSCTSTGMPSGTSLSFIWFDDASLTLE
jgi:hypothetical protein